MKWNEILSFQPDFLKTMLLYSEEYYERKNDSAFYGNKGLNPKLVPLIVNKAHSDSLRVSVHVETAYDFHVAVEAGVDEIAHLPGLENIQLISEEDVVLAKEKGIVVVTTASLISKKENDSIYKHLVEGLKTNLSLLKKYDVNVAIGSDMYNDTSKEEFKLLYDLGVYRNLELLKMWCENSPMTIFPKRKIGLLAEGYEGSFLVLNKNPLVKLRNVNNDIELRIKQGVILKSKDKNE
jgi:imidazolonepropionase-like amidohydrolase